MSDFPVKSVGVRFQIVQQSAHVSPSVVAPLVQTSASRGSAEQNLNGGQSGAGQYRGAQAGHALFVAPADKRLTGPPPAFEANVLDVETELSFMIKQIEAARERQRSKDAVEPAPKTDTKTDAPAAADNAVNGRDAAAEPTHEPRLLP